MKIWHAAKYVVCMHVYICTVYNVGFVYLKCSTCVEFVLFAFGIVTGQCCMTMCAYIHIQQHQYEYKVDFIRIRVISDLARM